MPNLQSSYLNLSLKNPIIVASSGLTGNLPKLKACEDAGAGAVVLKSLFEEAFTKDEWKIAGQDSYHPEMYEYINSELELQYGKTDYLKLISDAKKSLDIPVIASINCVSARHWIGFAEQMENAGADALELNVFSFPFSFKEESASVEEKYYEILEQVKEKIKIPVTMKIGRYFSSLANFANKLQIRGLDGLVLFNRFTIPDVDPDTGKIRTTFYFTQENEFLESLRWIAVLFDQVTFDLSATTGIKKGDDIIKLLLSGASSVQLASVLYEKGLSVINEMIQELDSWMDKNGYETIDEFKGKSSFKNISDPELFLRAQFMEKIRGVE